MPEICIENAKTPVRGLRYSCWGGAVTVLDAKTFKVKRVIPEKTVRKLDQFFIDHYFDRDNRGVKKAAGKGQ